MDTRRILITLPEATLTQEESARLFKQAQAGCPTSRTRLIESNLRLVLTITHRFRSAKEAFEDLFQVGTIGLVKAVDKFDMSRGVQFSTYAVPLIAGEIKRHLRDHHHTMRVSRTIYENARRIWLFEEQFTKTSGREPTLQEVSDGTGLPFTDLILAKNSNHELTSLSAPLNGTDGGESSSFLEEMIEGGTNSIDQWIDARFLSEGLEQLSRKEQILLTRRFFRDQTQTEIAEELGISQAQISRMEKQALQKIEKWMA